MVSTSHMACLPYMRKREYLTRSSMNTVDNEVLAVELRSAHHAYTVHQAEQARTMVILTPQFVELPLHTKYKGKGEPLLHGDPPIPVTRCLPRPLGCSVPINAKWYNVCPLEDICFKELQELVKMTPPAEHMWEMNITFRHVQAQRCIDNPRQDWFGVGPGTAGDIVTVLHGWKHNPEGIPLPIRGESDGTLNISDIDVWMWLKKLSPKSRPVSMSLKAPLISLFIKPGRWSDLVNPRVSHSLRRHSDIVHHIALPDRRV
jgi:hypothetical protein